MLAGPGWSGRSQEPCPSRKGGRSGGRCSWRGGGEVAKGRTGCLGNTRRLGRQEGVSLGQVGDVVGDLGRAQRTQARRARSGLDLSQGRKEGEPTSV